MANVVIRVENVSKRYVIQRNNERSGNGLRHILEDAINAPFRALRRRRSGLSQDNTGKTEDF